MKFLLIFLVIQSASASSDPLVDAAQKSVEALIRPLMANSPAKRPQGAEKFRVDSCEKHQMNWMNVLLRKQDARLSFSFREGCDIDGIIEPKFLEEFSANLNLRNLQNFTRIETMNTVSANLETKPILNLKMRQGRLKGPESTVFFEADYGLRINPSETKVLSENLGGELRILEINGRKVSLKRKIWVK
jgi:hypothetical protein